MALMSTNCAFVISTLPVCGIWGGPPCTSVYHTKHATKGKRQFQLSISRNCVFFSIYKCAVWGSPTSLPRRAVPLTLSARKLLLITFYETRRPYWAGSCSRHRTKLRRSFEVNDERSTITKQLVWLSSRSRRTQKIQSDSVKSHLLSECEYRLAGHGTSESTRSCTYGTVSPNTCHGGSGWKAAVSADDKQDSSVQLPSLFWPSADRTTAFACQYTRRSRSLTQKRLQRPPRRT